jgi:hypothetical protein
MRRIFVETIGVTACLVLVTLAAPLYAQTSTTISTDQAHSDSGFWASWYRRSRQAQLEQPDWLTPAVTSTARLKQEIRYDISWQRNTDGTTTENYGGSKGLALIPFDRIEISVNAPPFIVHNELRVHDGFGDLSFMTKVRILARNRKSGDYALTAFLAISSPTGSHRNGSLHPVITPTIAGGKGLGDFVYQGTLGVDLPSAGTGVSGRRLLLNNAVQYRGWGKFWPEIEANSSFYNGGINGGSKQVYLTPGVVAGRFPIFGRVHLTVGGGIEIAVKRYHSSTHQEVLTFRLPF